MFAHCALCRAPHMPLKTINLTISHIGCIAFSPLYPQELESSSIPQRVERRQLTDPCHPCYNNKHVSQQLFFGSSAMRCQVAGALGIVDRNDAGSLCVCSDLKFSARCCCTLRAPASFMPFRSSAC